MIGCITVRGGGKGHRSGGDWWPPWLECLAHQTWSSFLLFSFFAHQPRPFYYPSWPTRHDLFSSFFFLSFLAFLAQPRHGPISPFSYLFITFFYHSCSFLWSFLAHQPWSSFNSFHPLSSCLVACHPWSRISLSSLFHLVFSWPSFLI